MDFSERRPGFLDLLDSDPSKGMEQFYSYSRALWKMVPPKLVLRFSEDERQELYSEVIMHCTKDDFRVLRTYEDEGRAFRSWLMVIAHNRILDILSRENRIKRTEDGNIESLVETRSEIAPAAGGDPDGHFAQLVKTVLEHTQRMSERCILLLVLAAFECKPAEIALLLGPESGTGKKVSDDLRECRRQLLKRLTDDGIDVKNELNS